MIEVLSGFLVGLTLGLIGGASRGEKMRERVIYVIGIIIAAIFGGGYLVKPELINVTLQFISSLSIGFIFAFIVGSVYKNKRYGGAVLFALGRPTRVDTKVSINMFGVKWIALIEENESPYVYIEGPFCPKCDYEMEANVKRKLFGLIRKYIWNCVPCDIEYKRPREAAGQTRETVKKWVESKIRRGEIRQARA